MSFSAWPDADIGLGSPIGFAMDFILNLTGSETCGLFPSKVTEKILLDPLGSVVWTVLIFFSSVPLCYYRACLLKVLWFYLDGLMQ